MVTCGTAIFVLNVETAMKPRGKSRIELPTRNRVEPFRQGELDRLCGVYSILNAIHIGLASYTAIRFSEPRRNFRLAIDYLAARKTALDSLTNGMAMQRAFGLAKFLTRSLSDHSRQLNVEKPSALLNGTIEHLLDWVEESLALSMPVVVRLEGEFRHYSVIAGIDRTRLYLFDSGELRSIKRKDCAVRGGVHTLAATSMFRVRITRFDPTNIPPASGGVPRSKVGGSA